MYIFIYLRIACMYVCMQYAHDRQPTNQNPSQQFLSLIPQCPDYYSASYTYSVDFR